MSSDLVIRRAMFPSLILTATLLVLTPNNSRAEGPGVSPPDSPSYEASRNGAAASGLSAASTFGSATISAGQLVRNDGTSSGEDTLAENAWDFTKPDSIPGFASTPYPVVANPESAD